MCPVRAAPRLCRMGAETYFDVRRTYDRIDTRTVLRCYASLAVVAGLNITGTGVRGIPGVPLAHASLIWIAGMAIVAAGCAAAGLSLNDDPVARRRSLVLFAVGHIVLGLIVWMQWAVYWKTQGMPLPMALAPLAAGVVLLIAAIPASVSGADDHGAAGARHIRSAYDEHIRQIARREERARLARDLHDAVKQQLFVIQTSAATAQARLDEDAAGTREALAQLRAAAREATTEMEALLDELQAVPMEITGLVEALKKQSEALALRTGADVIFEPRTLPVAASLPPGAHEAIYRVAQEALANVARHARATRVTVALQSDARGFELRVADDGSGFDAGAHPNGMGISNMETRAAEFGGRISIVSAPSGTEVVMSVPLVNDVKRNAWRSVALFTLLVLGLAVFYGLRGPSPDLPIALFVVGLFGLWALWILVWAYRKPSRQRLR